MKYNKKSRQQKTHKKFSKNSSMKSRLVKINKKKSPFSSVLNTILKRNNILVKILIIVIVTTTGLTAFSFFIGKKNEVLPEQANFYDFQLSNKNRKQINDLINDEINPKLSNMNLVLTFGDSDLKINAGDFDFTVDANNFFESAKKTNFSNNEIIRPKLKYNESKLQKCLKNFSETSKILPAPFSYNRNGDILTVRAGHNGKILNIEKTKKKIIEAFSNFEDNEIIEAEFDIIESKNKKIDLEKIKKAIECEPKNASFQPGKTEKEQIGVKLESSKIDNPNEGTYKLKLRLIKPQITVADLRKDAKKYTTDLLSSFSTYWGPNKPANNIYNIKEAARLINDIILMPGDIFSFNNATRNGHYKKAVVFDVHAVGGERLDDGGGICQASSTLFGALLYGYFEILQRFCHSFVVHYTKIGCDAAVSDGSKDLVFRNNRKFPIKIVAGCTSNSIYIKILGKQLPEEKYDVSIDSHKTKETPTYINAEMTQTVRQNGAKIYNKTYYSHYLVRDKDIKKALAEEARKSEEAKKKAEEEAKKAENAKIVEEAKKAEETKKQTEEEAKKAANARIAEETKAIEESKKNEVKTQELEQKPNDTIAKPSTPAPKSTSPQQDSEKNNIIPSDQLKTDDQTKNNLTDSRQINSKVNTTETNTLTIETPAPRPT